jgi:hypothetical protein
LALQHPEVGAHFRAYLSQLQLSENLTTARLLAAA